jgi:amidophosphoribosyltransferase
MSGVFGFHGKGNAFVEAKSGLEHLCHRGQESWGIVSGTRDGSFAEVRKRGSIFQSPVDRPHFGSVAIGHVRYPTAGEASERNAQPIVGSFRKEKIALVHNGHVPRYRHLMEEMGGLFQTETDTEVIMHLIARAGGTDFTEKVMNALNRLGRDSSFSLIILHKGRLIAARDPFGFRPLSLGRRGEEEDDYEWAIASETCAFRDQFEYIGDVEPGQMAVVDREGLKRISFASPNPYPCILECIDYASPASSVFSKNVYEFREKAGARLAEGETERADMILPIPRAAIPAALGFHSVTSIPFREAISTVGEIGRIFIISKEKDRLDKVEKKFQINRDLIKGKEVFLVDTILVRGSTTMVLIPKLREAGVGKIHLRLAAPPPRFPCFMGMAMAKAGELLGVNRNDEDLRRLLKVDTFRYLGVEELGELTGTAFCNACLTGRYPFPVP